MWKPSRVNEGAWTLWRDGYPLGSYFPNQGYFPCKDDGTFGDEGVSPIPVPKVDENSKDNFGVDIKKVCPDPECRIKRYWICGKEVAPHIAYAAFGDGLVDDRGKSWVVCCGDKEMRNIFEGLWKQIPQTTKDKFHCQVYDDSHWDAKAIGLTRGITIMGPVKADGRSLVLSRFRAMPSVEQLHNALRKADPNRDPNKDPDPLAPAPEPVKPDPKKPDCPDCPKKEDNSNWILLLLGAVVVFFLLRNGGSK